MFEGAHLSDPQHDGSEEAVGSTHQGPMPIQRPVLQVWGFPL